jgi:hypothetical protein
LISKIVFCQGRNGYSSSLLVFVGEDVKNQNNTYRFEKVCNVGCTTNHCYAPIGRYYILLI